MVICLAVTTASTDRHKDHTHQEPERAELNNTCREATSRGIPGAGSDSYCPTSSTGCWEICSVSSTGADIWIWRISQGSSTTRSEEMLHLLHLAPGAGGSFPPSYLMAHPCTASLPLLPQPHQTCLAEAAVLSTIPKCAGKIQSGRWHNHREK